MSCGSGTSSAKRIADAGRVEAGDTAANRVVYFLGDVRQGRDPSIEGGVEDPFGSAYSQLCGRLKRRVSEAEFRDSKGARVSDALTADTGAVARHGNLEGTPHERIGVDAERESLETLSPSVRSTWVNVDLKWYQHNPDGSVGLDDPREETWRVELVKHGTRWEVCGFTPASP